MTVSGELTAVLQGLGVGVLLVVFASALWHKFRSMVRFQAVLGAYRLVSERWTAPMSWTLVGMEAAALVGLVVQPSVGAALALVLLMIYTAAIMAVILQGRTDVDCGCGDTPTPINGWLILRNAGLIAIAFACLDAELQFLSWSLWVLVSAGIAGLAVLYFAAEQMLANAGFWQRVQRGREM